MELLQEVTSAVSLQLDVHPRAAGTSWRLPSLGWKQYLSLLADGCPKDTADTGLSSQYTGKALLLLALY